jgi:TrmH RNA methyltransferase
MPGAPQGHERKPVAREPEQRIHGVNACLAAFAQRARDLRKVWLVETSIPVFKPVLAWCVKHRIGYRVVAEEDLQRLTGSSHHEGICFDLRQPPAFTLDGLLERLGNDAPALLLWLEGVGNPHNLGAILRSAAHFGVKGVLLPEHGGSLPSGAAYRVAEGGAETVPVLRVANTDVAIASLRRAGFALAATVVRGGEPLYGVAMPARLLLLLGAESEGLPDRLSAISDLRLRIPGSGNVESLNVSVAAALCIAEWARTHAVTAGASP